VLPYMYVTGRQMEMSKFVIVVEVDGNVGRGE
jgi:hypothetical protein